MTQTLVTPPKAGSYLVLYGVSWEMYEQLLTIFTEHPTPRMTYYKGTLELRTPLPECECYSWTLGRLITALSEELELEIRGLKSTTWRSQPKAVGKEADECFYIQNEPAIRGKLKINLAVDPPPDLAIEIDTTHSSVNQMDIYAELKVPEVWRWQQGKLSLYCLTETGVCRIREQFSVWFVSGERIGAVYAIRLGERRKCSTAGISAVGAIAIAKPENC